MYSFKNDYSEGCHRRVLELLTKHNMEQLPGYGDDKYCDLAREAIKKYTKNDAAIHFVSGGTQANTIVIASLLKPYECVIAAQTGHINVHEAGAIEATGHKVEVCHSDNGKLTPHHINQVMTNFEDHHMVKPKLVYISNTTEVGTVYTKQELSALKATCTTHDLFLFLDGARLGSGLDASDLTMKDIATLTDIFYIGGTKNGALLGEAIVINNEALRSDFLFHIKQRGGLLAKGRLLGLQFLALFEDDLYFRLAHHANSMAQQLSQGISNMGYPFLSSSQSNQIFPILPHTVIAKLTEHFSFYTWQHIDDNHSAIRLVTSWATEEKAVARFLNTLKNLSG